MSNSNKVPKVVVTDEYEIRVGSYYGSHIDLHRDCIDELVELLQAAKAWANTSAKSHPKPERSPVIVVKEGAVSDEDEAPL